MKLSFEWMGIIFFALIANPASSQDIWEFPQSFPQTWRQTGERRMFLPGELYRHINGAAELYLELGFRSLQIQSYSDGENQLVFEVFKMRTPAAAYSAFLSHRVRPSESQKETITFSVNRYQSVLCTGNYYIQIINQTGDTTLISDMTGIAGNIAATTDDQVLWLLALLPEENRIPGTVAVFNGPLSLRPLVAVGINDLLPPDGSVFGIAAEYVYPDNQHILKIIITYADRDQARSELEKFSDRKESCINIMRKTRDHVEFQTCDRRNAVLNLSDAALIIEIDQ